MKIYRDEEFERSLLQKIEEREFQDRTHDLPHSSDLIYCINRSILNRLNPESIDKATALRFAIGFATQRWLTNQGEDVSTIEVDGILVTPDALICPECGEVFNGRES